MVTQYCLTLSVALISIWHIGLINSCFHTIAPMSTDPAQDNRGGELISNRDSYYDLRITFTLISLDVVEHSLCATSNQVRLSLYVSSYRNWLK